MLFKYNKIKHPLDRFHLYIKHLVLDVWCRADSQFTTDLLHHEFAPIVNGMPSHYLLDPIREIYDELKKRPKSLKRLLHDGFRKNNEIEKLCAGTVTPVFYYQIELIDQQFKKKLHKFFVDAYELLDDPRVVSALQGINGHYSAFFKRGVNKTTCPFCGMVELLNSVNSKRDAYDHFFPKEKYPFNSVNFENLVPMCHTCNSKYKTRKDPINLWRSINRKQPFYPFYNGTSTAIEIEFTFNTIDLKNISSSNVQVDITSDNSSLEVNRWQEIFGIQERYKAICCDDSSFVWLEEYQQHLRLGSTLTFDQYISTKAISKFSNKKFLEIAYLKACKKVGVIS